MRGEAQTIPGHAITPGTGTHATIPNRLRNRPRAAAAFLQLIVFKTILPALELADFSTPRGAHDSRAPAAEPFMPAERTKSETP